MPYCYYYLGYSTSDSSMTCESKQAALTCLMTNFTSYPDGYLNYVASSRGSLSCQVRRSVGSLTCQGGRMGGALEQTRTHVRAPEGRYVLSVCLSVCLSARLSACPLVQPRGRLLAGLSSRRERSAVSGGSDDRLADRTARNDKPQRWSCGRLVVVAMVAAAVVLVLVAVVLVVVLVCYANASA